MLINKSNKITVFLAIMSLCFLVVRLNAAVSSKISASSEVKTAHAVSVTTHKGKPVAKGFYIGLKAGYGSTVWNRLIGEDNAALLSTPNHVDEGGASFGAILGYQFGPHFALEFDYLHIPQTSMTFKLPNPLVDNLKSLTTNTDVFGWMAKVLLPIKSGFSFYSGLGFELTHRHDKIYDKWSPGIVFSAGFDKNISRHVFVGLGAQLYTGEGRSIKDPINRYIPFVYFAGLDIGYRF